MVHVISSETSEEMVALAQSALEATAIYALKELTIESDGTQLMLTGRVTTFYHKQLAQEAVRTISKNIRVRNRIEVAEDL